MDNGIDLIDMMCTCYESTPDAVEDEPQYNFSALFRKSHAIVPRMCGVCPFKKSNLRKCSVIHMVTLGMLALAGTFKVAVLRKVAICVSAAVVRCSPS